MKRKLESIKNVLQIPFQLIQCAVGCILGFPSEDVIEAVYDTWIDSDY